MARFTNQGYGIVDVLDSNWIQRIDYDASDRPLYIGIAAAGTATSAAKWSIRKLTYSATGQVTQVDFAGGTSGLEKVWDNRASYSYS